MSICNFNRSPWNENKQSTIVLKALSVSGRMFFFFYGHAAAVKISVGAEGKEVGLFSLVFGVLTKTEAQI